MAQLTEAGRKMIGKYLDHCATVEASTTLKPIYTGKDGRIFMTLSPGSGSEAATVRKLVRDGFAEGCFNWCGGNRWMIPTDAGLRAFGEQVSA